MNFTENWLAHAEDNLIECMKHVPNKHNFLEIGCFEGRSTCWLLQNALEEGMYMTCVDTFNPYWYKGENLRKVFDDNVRQAVRLNQIVSVFAMHSPLALAQIISKGLTYDFIYVDGDHTPQGALTDAVMAWQTLKTGGVMLFDDYEYDMEPTKIGLDAFLKAFEGKYDLILQNYQLAVKKK